MSLLGTDIFRDLVKNASLLSKNVNLCRIAQNVCGVLHESGFGFRINLIIKHLDLN